MSADQQQYLHASIKTADNLRTVAMSFPLQALSALSLPEIEAAVEAVSRVTPAGNVPAMILSGLARLPNRQPPLETVKRDIDLLFRGIEATLDKVVYGTFFAGPAAVIWGYQHLLKLAGKEPEASFPEGLWQFYANYALREDTARFTGETNGFDTVLRHHHIQLSPVNRVVAWVMAAVHCLHQYNDLLANEWRERVYTDLLQEVVQGQPDANRFRNLYREWEQKRPYRRGHDAEPDENYAAYRLRKFDQFLRLALDQLDGKTRHEWNHRIQAAKEKLSAYQQQMSMLAYLEPTNYGETRKPLSLREACIGLIYQGWYYLIPACLPGTTSPLTVEYAQAQVDAILRQSSRSSAVHLSPLARLQRHEWVNLRRELNPTLSESLKRLRQAPILINADQQPSQLPLSELRHAERGVGDHALTIFDTQQSFVFDCSHIFFDGAWSAALAEILTQEALAWAVYLGESVVSAESQLPVIKPLVLSLGGREMGFVQQAQTVAIEVTAETTAVRLKPILALRKMFKMRSDRLQLTVNDLLILYRAIHAVTYRPDPTFLTTLETLKRNEKLETAVSQTLAALETTNQTPAILIPVDASKKDPKQRIYPLVFEVPLYDLNLLDLHRQTVEALDAYQQAPPHKRASTYTDFDRLQHQYLATLSGFGQVLDKAKEIAVRGEGTSQGAIKLLAHMPTPLQRLLDTIPNRFDVLNDLIKGREVFSNVGTVVSSSSLSRFSTAKDDNDKKTLAWGVLTDANGTMHISLRDFRPHIAALVKAGQSQLARHMTQHYLDTYAHGLNHFVSELSRITRSSRETQVAPLFENAE